MFLTGLSVNIHRIDTKRSMFLPSLSVYIQRIDTKRSMFLPSRSIQIIDAKRIMFLQVCLFTSRLRIDTKRILCFCRSVCLHPDWELTQNVYYVSAGLSVYIQTENWHKTYYVSAGLSVYSQTENWHKTYIMFLPGRSIHRIDTKRILFLAGRFVYTLCIGPV